MTPPCAPPDVALPAWEFPEDVFLAGHDSDARLVDLNRGRFYALDPVGRRMIELALTVGDGEVAAVLAAEFRTARETAERDWADFRSELRALRLLRPAGHRPAPRPSARPVRAPSATAPGRLTVWGLLLRAWVSLRLFGWARTLRRLGASHLPPRETDPDARDAALRLIDDAVRHTAARMLLNPECKERAIVAWHLLRTRFGFPARLVVGVRPYPFEAHAWVECAGRYVTDDEHRCTLFTPVAAYD